LSDQEACDPEYWAQHMRRTVRFRAALDTLLAEPELALLEVGPGKALTTFASYRAPGDTRPRVLAASTLPGQVEQEAEWSALLGAVGRLWARGEPLDFRGLYAGEQRRRIALPGTSFERTRHWFDSVPQRAPQVSAVPAAVMPPPLAVAGNAPIMSQAHAPRRARLLTELRALIEDTSGIDLEPDSEQLDFVELGIDSLAVTQLATRLKKQYGLAIPMRQLIDETSSLSTLAEFLDRTLPAEAEVAPAAAPVLNTAPALPQVSAALPQLSGPPNQLAAQLVQLQITQLTLLQHLLSGSAAAPQAQAPAHTPPVAPQSPAQGAQPAVMTEPADAKPGQTRYDPQKAFGAIARIYKHVDEMTPRQEARLRNLEERYCAKTQRSKEHTQQNRARHADPRVVTGFKPRLKELIYPLVTSRALGARIWDLDGNEYVDALNGFGSNFFGYSSPVIADALRAQIDLGYEIGPQTPLAGPCADLVCELTGMDRAAFCNTGSEAVMGALRIARTVTGRGLVVVFAGSYHGIFDEVIVRDTKSMRSVPAAPGILPEAVHNVLVLEYGTQQSLDVIRERADELAAVLVEPVQSRRPDFRPREFLQEVRTITQQAGAALIFDEVITGFRVHPGGAQHFYGIEADLATYGKIVGGGMPIGVIAGRNPWMDALDGGFWQFGDDSVPTAGVTYFAGTFVRHPLAKVAALKALEHMKAEGPALQERINDKTAAMVKQLNDFFRAVNAPLEIRSFASLWKTFYTEPQPYGELLFCYLRDLGLHIWDGFPCFLTLAHQDADIAFIVSAFTTAVREMQSGGFFPSQEKPANDAAHPPVPGARLGRDAKGNPAWFVAHPAEPGKYVMVS
ncbi:MAG: aminotransferase class III-fold pyridoxal phosphate-dependent enzyme, partial [Polyangiales bacterium]